MASSFVSFGASEMHHEKRVCGLYATRGEILQGSRGLQPLALHYELSFSAYDRIFVVTPISNVLGVLGVQKPIIKPNCVAAMFLGDCAYYPGSKYSTRLTDLLTPKPPADGLLHRARQCRSQPQSASRTAGVIDTNYEPDEPEDGGYRNGPEILSIHHKQIFYLFCFSVPEAACINRR